MTAEIASAQRSASQFTGFSPGRSRLSRNTPTQAVTKSPIGTPCATAQPLADFAIYRRVWGLPPAGLAALKRKTAINEAVLGYGGELYLYLWARRRAGLANPPFAAIKDVNILSSILGFAVTLAALPPPPSPPWPAHLVVIAVLGALDLRRAAFAEHAIVAANETRGNTDVRAGADQARRRRAD
jgi:hypothetical protein